MLSEAIGIMPEPPPGMKQQASLPERIYTITEEPLATAGRTRQPPLR